MSERLLLRVEGLEKHFPVTAGVMGRAVGQVKAVDGVSFEIEAGSTLGLVGESGCGKTTVGKTLLRLLEPTGGRVEFEGVDIAKLDAADLRLRRRDMQIVFQDPFNSLNPRMTVADIVGEAMRVHGLATRDDFEEKVGRILERVGIPSAWMNRYPHEFSGGQRQRISVARAIALEPKLIVCDEAVSALDVSIQAQVINLLIGLRKEMGLAFLFISHDLSVVKHISDRIAVMYLGQIVETAPANQLFETPAHPYTRALLSAIPVPDPRRRPDRIVLAGDVPTPLDPPNGCRFHTRCPAAMERCSRDVPPVIALPGGQTVSCFLAEPAGTEPEPAVGEGWYSALLARARHAESERTRRVRPQQAAGVGTTPPVESPSEGAETRESLERIEVTHTLAHRIGAAGLLLAALAMLSGMVVAGAFLALATFRICFFADVAAERRAGIVAGLLAAVAALGWVGNGLEQGRLVSAAQRQHEALAAAVEEAAALRGRYPKSLSELGWRLPEIVGDANALDPWGRPWSYRAPASPGEGPSLGSAGPDGVPGSEDDIGGPPIEAASASAGTG